MPYDRLPRIKEDELRIIRPLKEKLPEVLEEDEIPTIVERIKQVKFDLEIWWLARKIK